MTTPTIIYAAKSTEDKHGSIPTQIADCREAIERQGGREIVEEFKDEARSAYHGNRGPGLAAAKATAIQAAQEHGGAELWVQHSDRLARGDGLTADHLVEVWLEMRRAGVRLRSVQDDSNLENIVMAVLIGERNTEDSRRKGQAVSDGKRRQFKRGEHLGAPNYGLRKRDGRVIPEPSELVTVERIYREYEAGASMNAIQRGLNDEGVIGPERKGQRGTWHQGSVGRILRNPVYAGKVVYRGEVIEGSHEPLIPVDLWEAVQRRLAAVAETSSKGRGRPPRGTHLFLNGLLRCGHCGSAMSPRGDYYACRGRLQRGPEFCAQPRVKRGQIDVATFSYFDAAAHDREQTERAVAAQVENKLAETSALRIEAEREQRRAVERYERVRRDYQDGKLDADDWRDQREQLTAEQDAAGAALTRLFQQEAAIGGAARHDAEADTLRFLAEVQLAIASGRGTGDIAAVRAALVSRFEGFTLRQLSPTEQKGVYVKQADGLGVADRDVIAPDLIGIGPRGEYEIVPHIRANAIAGYGPLGITPMPERVGLSRAENNSSQACLYE